MNIDDKITQALEAEAKRLEPMLLDDKGLFSRLLPIYRGGMRRWVWLVNGLTLLTSALMFWTAYEFFSAQLVEQLVFWGVCLIVILQLQVGLKNWLFMEMNRASLAREMKRLEITLMQTKNP
ncbi:DUF6768 family protein [Paraglaciecola hydrolytica]|uniref:Uncharacterized protein n=1 Tax=Paraglaciecola hydrolytica TaxID=1799789 RepID=A0A136A2Z9_9ALTE|nr:DUF6768 family protein [Paraglaciecola hydrolytica]KXI29611.1 hypothetical protein AX660_06045 [Paraglaciecola hydrolytica]